MKNKVTKKDVENILNDAYELCSMSMTKEEHIDNINFSLRQKLIKRNRSEKSIKRFIDKYNYEHSDIFAQKPQIKFVNTNTIARAKIYKNIIEVNLENLNTWVNELREEGQVGTIYKVERQYIDKYVFYTIDLVRWVIAHEYAHCLYPQLKHTKDFFRRVEEIYLKFENNIK